MASIQMKELLEAGVHFGHQTRRWNPKMKPYIFGKRNGIHIVDLQKTLQHFEEAAEFVRGLAATLNEGWVMVSPGVGISPSGLVLELKDHVLRAPVDDAALRAALNQGRYGWLTSGLYLLLLSWHEVPSDAIAEAYPRQASQAPEAQPDSYEQGVRLELMALAEPLPVDDELNARALLAERFLVSGAELPGQPANSIVLGLLAVRSGSTARWCAGSSAPSARPTRSACAASPTMPTCSRTWCGCATRASPSSSTAITARFRPERSARCSRGTTTAPVSPSVRMAICSPSGIRV